MLISCTSVVLEKEELEKKLRKRGIFNPNRFLIGNRPITKIELRYVEYLILEYDLTFRENLLDLKREQGSTVGIRLIGNGSTGSVSFLEKMPETEQREFGELLVQKADYKAEDMRKEAVFTAGKVCRKLLGKRCRQVELKNVWSLYRPFWAVFYGEPRKDGSVLCCPYAADGFTVK